MFNVIVKGHESIDSYSLNELYKGGVFESQKEKGFVGPFTLVSKINNEKGRYMMMRVVMNMKMMCNMFQLYITQRRFYNKNPKSLTIKTTIPRSNPQMEDQRIF